MQSCKKHIVRIVTLILALQLLNLSIYAQDFKPICILPDNSEININESVVEFVVEVVLNHKNAIPEQQQHHKDLHFHKHISFKAIDFQRTDELSPSQILNSKRSVPLHVSFLDLYQQDIRPQPPKA